MIVDEGMAVRNGERLNIQCLKLESKRDGIRSLYHYHKYIEFLYFLEGERDVYVGDDCIRCKKDSLFVIFANEPHSFLNVTDSSYYVIKFLPDVLRVAQQSTKEFEYVFNFSNCKHSRVIMDCNGELKRLFDDAWKKFTDDVYSGELFVRSALIRICAEIISKWHDAGEIIPIGETVCHENMARIQGVIEKTKEACGTFKTREAAKMCNMSDGHFSRTFKGIMNMPFMKYAKSVKMQEAERLLKCTDKSVTEISQLLNYASASHFIEDFRKEKGMSPRQYKKGM